MSDEQGCSNRLGIPFSYLNLKQAGTAEVQPTADPVVMIVRKKGYGI